MPGRHEADEKYTVRWYERPEAVLAAARGQRDVAQRLLSSLECQRRSIQARLEAVRAEVEVNERMVQVHDLVRTGRFTEKQAERLTRAQSLNQALVECEPALVAARHVLSEVEARIAECLRLREEAAEAERAKVQAEEPELADESSDSPDQSDESDGEVDESSNWPGQSGRTFGSEFRGRTMRDNADYHQRYGRWIP